jgi:hypothetical protein
MQQIVRVSYPETGHLTNFFYLCLYFSLTVGLRVPYPAAAITGKTSYKARGLISSVSGKRSLSVIVKEKDTTQ